MTTSTVLPAHDAPLNPSPCPTERPTSRGIARRAVLAHTAAALGLGAAANVMAVVATRSESAEADRDLLELGRTFDQMVKRLRALRDQYRQVWDAGYGAAFEALRQEYRRRRRALGANDIDEDARYMARLDQLQREWGVDVLLEAQTPETDAMDPVQRAIVATSATTLAGLAVKARCAAFWCSHWSDATDEDCDVDTRHARDVIAAVIALAERRAS